MDYKEIKREVMNRFDFARVVMHLDGNPSSKPVMMEELEKASRLIDNTSSDADKDGKYEMNRGNYVCKIEKENGEIVSMTLEYAEVVSSYTYCE